MTTPAEYDTELHTLPWAEVYARHSGDAARQALAMAYARDEQLTQEALGMLSPSADPLSEGIRLFLLANAGHHAQTLAEYQLMPGTEERTLEGNLYAMVAKAVSSGEQGNLGQAIAQLHTAGVLAGLMGAHYRQQWCGLEQERLLLVHGMASAQRVRNAMALAPTTPGRRQYAQQIEGAALLAEGQYLEAGRTAGGHVQALALALQSGAALPTVPDEGFGSLALGAQALLRGEDPAPLVASVTTEPEATYAWLLCSAHNLSRGERPALHVMPAPADQRVLWALANWEALILGDDRHSAEMIITALREGLTTMSSHEPLLVAAPYAPRALAALTASPLAPLIRDGGPQQAVLMGEHLQWQGELHKLPGRTGGGAALLMHALGKEWPISRVERLRLRRAIEGFMLPAPPVYVTDIVRGLALLAPGGGASWMDAAARVTSQVTTRAVRRELVDQHDLSGRVHG